jgi:hypothetical protein
MKLKYILVFSVFLVIVLSSFQFSIILLAKTQKRIEGKDLRYKVSIDRINKSKSSLEVLKELTMRDVLN